MKCTIAFFQGLRRLELEPLLKASTKRWMSGNMTAEHDATNVKIYVYIQYIYIIFQSCGYACMLYHSKRYVYMYAILYMQVLYLTYIDIQKITYYANHQEDPKSAHPNDKSVKQFEFRESIFSFAPLGPLISRSMQLPASRRSLEAKEGQSCPTSRLISIGNTSHLPCVLLGCAGMFCSIHLIPQSPRLRFWVHRDDAAMFGTNVLPCCIFKKRRTAWLAMG